MSMFKSKALPGWYGQHPKGENYRRVIDLRKQGMGGKEIAQRLNITRARVYQLIALAQANKEI